MNLEKYNRPAIACNLNKFDPIFADINDFIEICKWKNGEGYDIAINDNHYSFTIGEIEAINYLIAELNKS